MARRWLKIGGGTAAGVTTIVGLIALLVSLYGFEITGTHDFLCDTNIEGYGDWCDSLINITNPNVYDVDIYNQDAVRLEFSPNVKEFYLFRKDGRCRGGISCAAPNGMSVPGWNFIDFTNETKPLDDKVYVYRFPARSTKEFRLLGKKPADVDMLKWDFILDTDARGMDGYLDPIWGNNFTKTDWIPNIMDFTEPSVSSFHSMDLNLTNPTDETIILNLANGENLGVRVDNEINPSTAYLDVPIFVYNHTIPIKQNVTVNITVWNENGSRIEEITEEQTVGQTIVEEKTKIYSENYAGVRQFEILIDGQSNLDSLEIEFLPGQSHIVEMRGYTRPGEAFDIIPIGWGGFEYTEAQEWRGENLTTDLRAFYQGQLTGTTVVDKSDNSADALAAGGVTNASDADGAYYIMNGVDGIINSSNYGISDANDITLTMWIKQNRSAGSPQGNFIGSTGNYAFGAISDGGNTRMCLQDGYISLDCTDVSSYNFANQQWMLYVARRYASNDSVDIFINGTLVHTATNDGTKDKDFYEIGNAAWFINGSVTSMGVWNKSLTNDEIAFIFEENRSYDPTDLGSNPVIVINSPTNDTDTMDVNPEVNITCTDADVADENMTFTIEFDSTLYYSGTCVNGTPIAVSNSSINLTQCVNYTITANVTDTGANAGSDTASGIYIGPTSTPTVILSTPANGTNTSDTTFDFTFTVLSSQADDFVCVGYANDTAVAYNGTVHNNTLTTITANATDYGYITNNVTCENVCGFSGEDTSTSYLGFALYGQTLKAAGGAEENVTILLINESSNTVYANWTSDASGIWQYNLSAAGTWQLDGRPTTSTNEGEMIWNFTTS